MNDKQKNYAIYAVFVILVLVAGYFGVKLPLPPIPDPLSGGLVQERGLSRIRIGQDVEMDQDLVVDGAASVGSTLGVTGAATLASTLDVTGATTLAANVAANGGITVDGSNFVVNGTTGAVSTASTLAVGGDVAMTSDSSGGNLGAKAEYIGLPKIALKGGGQGTNPAGQTISLVDDTPDGEFAPVDASVVESLATTIVKYGTNSYGAAFAADAAAGDGFLDANLGAGAAWDDMESAGLLVYSTATWAAGDLTLVLTDDGGARTFNIPALATANKWTWLEVDIATGDLSAVSDVAIKLSAQGETALGAFTMYLDLGYVWDSVDEEALGTAILQDGVLSVINTETGATLVELTDFIVHYENGNDFIVYITDQSTADIAVLIALQQIG